MLIPAEFWPNSITAARYWGLTEKWMIINNDEREQGCQIWPEIRPHWHNIGQICDFLKVSFQFHFARQTKMNLKLILTSPRFVQFGTNLALFPAKSDIPEMTKLCELFMSFQHLQNVRASYQLCGSNMSFMTKNNALYIHYYY